MKRTLITLAFVLLAAGALAPAARAGRPPLGLRTGYTNWNGTDQMHVGAHVKLGDFFPNIAFTPGVEYGFGNANSFALNGDLFYRATEFSVHPWGPYVGANIAVNWLDPHDGPSDTLFGLGLLVGTTYGLADGNELMGEVRIGLVDSPDLRLTVGYTFF